MAKPISNLGASESLTFGPRVITNFTNFKTLYGLTGTAGIYTSFTESGDTTASAYQVPSGKVFRVVAVELIGIEVTVNFVKEMVTIGYTDTATGLNNPVEGTTPKYLIGSGGGAGIGILPHTSIHQTTGGIGLSHVFYAIDDFSIPATKYPAGKSSGSTDSSIILYGYEE